MTVAGALVGRVLGLPPARTPRVRVERALAIPMADGVSVLADRYYPEQDPSAPLVLVRTPYGRSSTSFLPRLLAERGYQVLIVAVRGTGGSQGEFTGFRMEAGDGPALLAWLRQRPWFDGAFATWGGSFLGYSQWELAREPIPEWKAAFLLDAPSELYELAAYPGGALALDDWLGWTQQMADGRRDRSVMATLSGMPAEARARRRAVQHLPLTEVDRVAVGRTVGFFQDWIRTPGPWPDTDHRANVEHMPPVVWLVGGWHDPFLPGVLADGQALMATGRTVRLRIGPWVHGRGIFDRRVLRDLFGMLDHALGESDGKHGLDGDSGVDSKGGGELPGAPLELFVAGDDAGEPGEKRGGRVTSGRWREFDAWPPPGYRSRPWFLRQGREGGVLATDPPDSTGSSRFTYDPADPTLSVGGPRLRSGGVRDNRVLEERGDVLTFTSGPLAEPLEVIGEVQAEIHLRTSRPAADVFVRLCDVDDKGRSRNVCDGILRLGDGRAAGQADEAEVRVARVRLWPTAHVFGVGHRIRVQVSGGAHPRYMRNFGTGDQLGTSMIPVEHEVRHEPGYPSAIHLPTNDG